MKSVASMMGKYCTRCGKGIYTAWRTLDDKKFYHPHCFTCVVCEKILEEDLEEGEMASLKELYCPRCYMRCFRDEVQNRCESTFNSNPVCRNDGDQGYLENLLTENFNFKFQPRHEPPLLQSRRSGSDMNLLFSSQTYNSVHHEGTIAREHIKHSLPRPPQRGSHHKGNTIRSTQERILSPMDNLHQQHYDAPKAFLDMQNAKSNVRKLERQNSRIPRPITPSLSRKSTATGLGDSCRSMSPSKAKVSSQAKLGNSRRSSTNSHSNSSVNRSLSWVQPKSSKTQDIVGTASGTKRNQISRKPSRSRPRSVVEEKSKALSGSSSHSGPKACPSRRQCAASFSNNDEYFLDEYSDYHHHQYELAVGEFAQEPSNFECQNLNDMQLFQQSATIASVPSPQAILSAIRRNNSGLNKSNLSKSSTEHRSSDNGNSEAGAMMSNGKVNFHVTFECPICISSLVPGNESALLKARRPFGNGNVVTTCGHMFHRDCLENWLKIKGNKRCPICSAFCLPETLQPVYLECNLSADMDSKSGSSRDIPNLITGKVGKAKSYDSAFKALRSEYDLLKTKYNTILSEKNDYSLKVTIANSLQNAYDMECRSRLTLQWENKKLLRQIEALQSRLQQYTSEMTN